MVKPKKNIQKKETLMNGIHHTIQHLIYACIYTSGHTYVRLSALLVSKSRAPLRSKFILICVCDMHEEQMVIPIKKQCESAVMAQTMGHNAVFYSLGAVVMKLKGRMMKWILLLTSV